MKRVRILAIIGIVGLVIILVAGLSIKTAVRNFFYPAAPPMPAQVATPMTEVLAQLDTVLKAKAPQVLEKLQPGLSADEIARVENQGGFRLPDDLKALYQWHNGSRKYTNEIACDFIPGHFFLPLEDAAQERNLLLNQVDEGTFVQRAFFQVFAGHRKTWLPLFSDGAGDGYCYDPQRDPARGAVFFHFAETGYYVFFPSAKNLLAGTVKCYEQGAFKLKEGANPSTWDEAGFDTALKIWKQFGASNLPETY